MITVRGRVRNGRLIVDEATDLPEGTEIELVGGADVDDDVSLDEAPAADERLSAGEVQELRELGRGPFVLHEDVRARIAARKR